jgi:hypothetical protein
MLVEPARRSRIDRLGWLMTAFSIDCPAPGLPHIHGYRGVSTAPRTSCIDAWPAAPCLMSKLHTPRMRIRHRMYSTVQ